MNAIIKMLTDAFAGCGSPVSLGAIVPEGLDDTVVIAFRFVSPAEAEAFVRSLDAVADAARSEIIPDHKYILPAPDRVQ